MDPENPELPGGSRDPPPPSRDPPAPPRHTLDAALLARLANKVLTYRRMQQPLAFSDFYYIVFAGRLRCLSCGSTLRDWEPGDSPHLEHRTWAPACPFIAATPDPSQAAVDALSSPVPRTTWRYRREEHPNEHAGESNPAPSGSGTSTADGAFEERHSQSSKLRWIWAFLRLRFNVVVQIRFPWMIFRVCMGNGVPFSTSLRFLEPADRPSQEQRSWAPEIKVTIRTLPSLPAAAAPSPAVESTADAESVAEDTADTMQ